MFSFLANLAAVIHGASLIYFIIAIFLSLTGKLRKHRTLEFIFVAIILATVVPFLFYGGCFLTEWENSFRHQAGQPGYEGGFISHYLGKIGINVPDIIVHWTLITLIILGVFSEIYWNINPVRKL